MTIEIIDQIWDCRRYGWSANQIAKVVGVKPSLVHDVLQFRIIEETIKGA